MEDIYYYYYLFVCFLFFNFVLTQKVIQYTGERERGKQNLLYSYNCVDMHSIYFIYCCYLLYFYRNISFYLL